MGSKVVGFRCPDDLAKEFEQYCEAADKTTGEVLRKLVDDLIYPGSGRERLREKLGRGAGGEAATMADFEKLYGVKATEQIVEQVNTQIKEQLKEQLGDLVDERLELIQVDRALTEAERESLASLESELAEIKAVVDKLVQTNNRNVEMVNANSQDWGDKVSRLFQFLNAHTHDGAGMVNVSDRLAAEVALADKRVGELDEKPNIIQGKTELPGYKFLENLNLSVRE